MITKELKGTKAITLIAMVISILVLLILAGVSLALVVGENGIVGRAVTARKVHGTQETLEKIKLAISSAQIKGLGKVDEDTLKEDLTEYFGADGYTITGNSTDGWTISVAKDKVSYFVSPSARMEETEYEEPIDNSQSLVLGLVDDLGTRSTIYLYNNTDKITDGSITITMPDSSTETIVAQANTSNIEYSEEENRYATYTVSKNGTYTFSATANGETTETTVRIKNIEKFTPIEDLGLSFVNCENKAYSYKGASVPAGYFVDTKSNVDTGLVVTDEIDSEGYSIGNEWVWVPVNNTVGNDDYYLTTTEEVMANTAQTYTKYSKFWEFATNVSTNVTTRNVFSSQDTPKIATGYYEPGLFADEFDKGAYSLVDKRNTTAKINDINELAEQYTTDYENMIVSVDKYSGFYIGRYEVYEKSESMGESLNYPEWFYLYNKCMKMEKNNTESGMIYGALWDATMQWLAKCGYPVGYTGNNYSGYGNYASEEVKVKDEEISIIIKPINSEEKEPYPGASFTYTEYTGMVLETGQSSYTKSNNIYDLSGNYTEFTQSKVTSVDVDSRGGDFGCSSSDSTYFSTRYSGNWSEFATRASLYIK